MQLGKFLRRSEGMKNTQITGGYEHWCPGCESMHHFSTDAPQKNGARWTFDGNLDKPTFQPSMNIGPSWCHYKLIAGEIQFQGDCRHALAGKTVPLPELPEELRDGSGT